MCPITLGVKDLSKAYDGKVVLRDVSFSLGKGESLAIVGPNGAGKSTLLKCIVGLISMDFGSVMFNGQPIKSIKKKGQFLAYVSQRNGINWDFPLSCYEMVLMGRYPYLSVLRRISQKDKDLASQVVEKFELGEFKDSPISTLSGGQRQRTLLARAYLQNAEIYFLDEPFGGVDTPSELITFQLLRELQELGKTIVIVTHDIQSLTSYFDKLLLLNKELVAFGDPLSILNSENIQKTYGIALHQHIH